MDVEVKGSSKDQQAFDQICKNISEDRATYLSTTSVLSTSEGTAIEKRGTVGAGGTSYQVDMTINVNTTLAQVTTYVTVKIGGKRYNLSKELNLILGSTPVERIRSPQLDYTRRKP